VYAIAKNEAQFVARFCESAKEADLILIADTGSTDGTVKEIVDLKQKNIASFGITINPWRFDLARNAVLAAVPADMDVCVSLDLDEILQPGWRQEIERVWKPKTTRLRYLFNWGGPVEFYYEKIHARKGYKWHHPCHEYPMPYGIEEVWAQSDKLLVVHKPDATKSRQQYLKLLKMSVEEDPDCPRNAFYYAREHSFGYEGCDLNEAIKQANRYLGLPRATWPNERAYAYRVIGECHLKLGDLNSAELAYMQATREAPNTREPWVGLADICYRSNRWPECYAYAMRALGITDKGKVYTTDHTAWGYKPYLYACLGAWYIGLKNEALKYGGRALELEPGDKLLIDNLSVMKSMMGQANAG
jgi:tetratricopeptide (TPR) repeat protein